MKKLISLMLAVCMLAGMFTGCSSKRNQINEKVNQYDEYGISVQAMELIQFYCNHRQSFDAYGSDNVAFAFQFLNENSFLTKEQMTEQNGAEGYTLPYKGLMDVYQFFHAGKLPAGWWTVPSTYGDTLWTTDYTAYDCNLELISFEQSDETHFTAVFDRYYDNELYDRVSFAMEKQPVETAPELMEKVYGKVVEIWKIKSVSEVIPEFSETPKVVEIYTAADFRAFAKEINTYGDRCNQKLYVLKSDIDFNGAEITPVGTMSSKNEGTKQTLAGGFGARFDGGGHTLSNFTVSYSGGYLYAGLFSRISATGTVENLNIVNTTVKPAGYKTVSSAKGSGLLAGYCNGLIKNCSASGIVVGGRMTGGLVGHLYGLPEDGATYNSLLKYGVVKDCTVNAQVTGYSEVGNFVGFAHFGYIENSDASGSVTAFKNPNAVKEVNPTPFRIGGFCGTSLGTNMNYCNTSTTLTINDTPKHVGAFSATCESSSFYGCTYVRSKAPGYKAVSFTGVNSSVGVSAK